MRITKRSVLIAFCSLNLAGPVALAASPVYLGFSGQPTNITQDGLVNELEAKFTTPAEAMKPDVMVYYNWQVDGSNHLAFALIAQAMNPSGITKLATYVGQLDSSSFHGMAVQFQNVERIDETVTLFAGVHQTPASDSGGEDFNSNYQLKKNFALAGLSDWVTFTDRLGDAFLSKVSSDFQSYLAWFVDNADQLATLDNTVLAHDDVVLAELDPSIVLASGATASISPFYDLPFVRNCWNPSYEKGTCYQAVWSTGGRF